MKLMKKALVLILALVVCAGCLSLVACKDEEVKPESKTGYYTFTSMYDREEKKTYSHGDMYNSMFLTNASMVINLKADNTFERISRMSSSTSTSQGIWTENEENVLLLVFSSGSSAIAKIEGANMTLDFGSDMVYALTKNSDPNLVENTNIGDKTAGTYLFYSMRVGNSSTNYYAGDYVSSLSLSLTKYSFVLVLENDGKYVMFNVEGDKTTGNWTEGNETITIRPNSGSYISGMISDNTLTLNMTIDSTSCTVVLKK